MDNEVVREETTLILKNRSALTLNGVKNVLGFDEGSITLGCTDGQVLVDGEDLKIENLSKESGEIQITGKIDAVSFSNERQIRGVFARMFK